MSHACWTSISRSCSVHPLAKAAAVSALNLQAVREALLDLMGHMVVVNPASAHSILSHLHQYLLPPSTSPAVKDAPPDTGKGPWQPVQEQVAVLNSIVNTLAKVGVTWCAAARLCGFPPQLLQAASHYIAMLTACRSLPLFRQLQPCCFRCWLVASHTRSGTAMPSACT
jgi:hypothetical protein